MDNDQKKEKITLKMTAKGNYYWDIEVYGDPLRHGQLDGQEIARLKAADEELQKTFTYNVLAKGGDN